MAVVKKCNPNKYYYPDRLTERLETIYDYVITVVEAPTGYGKTTSIRNLVTNADEAFVWINIDNQNKNNFFQEVCDRIHSIDNSIAAKLISIGCPCDIESSEKIVTAISELPINERYTIVLDNYQYISDFHINNTILQLVQLIPQKFRFIILTQSIKSSVVIDLVQDQKINYIGKTDLEFTSNEITTYFRHCGVRLSEEEANYLFQYTEGWISAIYLQLLHYIEENQFEPDAGIDKLVCKAIWDKLNPQEQDFLIYISIYDSFSMKQAIFIGADELDEERIKKLLNANSFVRYDSKTRKYYAHAILRCYLKSEFDKLDIIIKKQVFEKAAYWYQENENYYMALENYYKIKKFAKIYSMNMSLDDLIPYLTKENKKMFLSIISKTPLDVKEKNIRRSIIFCFILFIYNEKDFFIKECETIIEMINQTDIFRKREKDILIGEVVFIQSFSKYNNLQDMYKYYEKAYQLMQSPSTIYSSKLSIIFKNPSVLTCFHSKTGKALEELDMYEKSMILYYKITSGNSKGLEALMRAEILFNKGNFADAQVLCQKALYMAETRNQVIVYICTMFLMARISIFEGDYDNLKYIRSSIRKKIETTGEIDKNFTADLCDGFIYILLEKCNGIPKWIKNAKSIEDKCSVLTLNYANIIYGKYLLLNEEYEKFLGISGQLLGSTKVYNNMMNEIYIYLYICIANDKIGNRLKAIKFLNLAIDCSYEDEFVIPFVENYAYIKNVFEPEQKYQYRIDFMQKVYTIYRKYEKNFKSTKLLCREDIDYGLTNREMQIARLAAERLTNKEIAEQLYIAVGTVKSNLKSIFSKLQISSRAELKEYFK